MKNIFHDNCCDGIYNSFDIHFTSACDNKCKHCIDLRYLGIIFDKPDIQAIANTIITNQEGYDDVLFLGGEPCLYLEDLIDCIDMIRDNTNLKIYVTTSVPKICYDRPELFHELLHKVDGINLSVQHYDESISDRIRNKVSKFDRQKFYNSLDYKEKIRINLNIVKPFLYIKEDIINCLNHYDRMGFNEIKISEIQHGKDYFVSFEKIFDIKLKSPYSNGCQTYLKMNNIIPRFKTPVLLKRSCFLCEKTLTASIKDGIKVVYKLIKQNNINKYGVVYENGFISNYWR